MILDRLFPTRADALTPAASDDYWYMSTGKNVASGVRVDHDTALQYSAVWACTRLLSEVPASLPLVLLRKLGKLGKEKAEDHPCYTLLHDAPNPEMSGHAFRAFMSTSQVNWGNGWAEIERSRAGRPLALWPIHPSRVKLRRDKQKRLQCLVTHQDQTVRQVPYDDMLHWPGIHSTDGITGTGVITYARECVGLGIATERYGAGWFGNSGIPGGVIKHPRKLTTASAKNLRESWNNVHQGPSNSSRVAILEEGMEFSPIGVPPEAAQFLGTRKFNREEVATWYGIPAHLVNLLEKASYASIEMLGMEFVTYCLLPWFRRVEQANWMKLLDRWEKPFYYWRHDVSELERGDRVARATANQIEFQCGALSDDEWRDGENRNPLPNNTGGKYYYQANNLVPIGEKAPEPKPATQIHVGQPAQPQPPEPAGTEPAGGEMLDVPDCRQLYDYDCGPAATRSVLGFYEIDKTQEELIEALHCTPENGTDSGEIVKYLIGEGLAVTTGSGMTIADLAEFHRKGQPVICAIQDYGTPADAEAERSGHYVVVIGVGMGCVFVQDPSADNVEQDAGSDAMPGRKMIAVADFDRLWHDVDSDGNELDHFGIAAAAAFGAGAGEEEKGGVGTEDTETDDGPAGSGSNSTDGKDKGEGDGQPQNTPNTGQDGPNMMAARSVLSDVLGRMFRKEANAVRRAAA